LSKSVNDTNINAFANYQVIRHLRGYMQLSTVYIILMARNSFRF